MSGNKIQIGYGSDKPLSQKYGLYGKRRSGKYMANGGFAGELVSDFTKISDKKWVSIFGTQNMPKWKKELIDLGISLE